MNLNQKYYKEFEVCKYVYQDVHCTMVYNTENTRCNLNAQPINEIMDTQWNIMQSLKMVMWTLNNQNNPEK